MIEPAHIASSNVQRKAYSSMLHPENSAVNVHDRAIFQGPQAGAGMNALNRSSTAFNFLNADIARDRGRPNAASKETLGSVYGGPVGQS